MTLWVANVVSYSAQLAALVGTAAVILSLLRIRAPRATLCFWQVMFMASVVWPGAQLLAHAFWPNGSTRFLTNAFASGVLSNTAAASALRAGVASVDGGLATLVMAVLLTGAIARLAWIGLGLSRLRALRTASEPAHALSAITSPLQRELGVTADIRFSDVVTSPATIGARRPAVLLPRCLTDLTPSAQRAVVCHELMHVRRRDWLATLLEEVWCAVLWFHPGARLLTSRLTLARETLVDKATICHTGDRRAYAEALLEFSSFRTPRIPGAIALIGRRHLERRIALIGQEVSMSRRSAASRLVVAVAVVALTTLVTTWSVPMTVTVDAQAGKIYKPDQDKTVTLPRPIREVKPVYTGAALRARIQGTVWLAVIVLATGDVGDVSVSKSLDAEYGLDEEAIKAARQWKFVPGAKDGESVPVEVTIEMTFTLKK
jgi:TonB family protein